MDSAIKRMHDDEGIARYLFNVIDEGDSLYDQRHELVRRTAAYSLSQQAQANGLHTSPNAVGMSFDIHQEITNYEELLKAQIQLKWEKQVIDDLFENLAGTTVMYRRNKKELFPGYVSKCSADLCGENGQAALNCGTRLVFDVVHPDDLPELQSFILIHIEKQGLLLTHRCRV